MTNLRLDIEGIEKTAILRWPVLNKRKNYSLK